MRQTRFLAQKAWLASIFRQQRRLAMVLAGSSWPFNRASVRTGRFPPLLGERIERFASGFKDGR
jgi:hypothetical protein